jgi:hypothetical protein
MRCPGADTRYWKPGDIYEVKCGKCGEILEFFKDDSRRTCKNCNQVIRNPKLDLGCIEHCEFSELCRGELNE